VTEEEKELQALREHIEDRLSWTPYEDVQRHRAEAVEAGVAVAAELLWLHAEAVWWLNLSRDEYEADEMLQVWFKRAEHGTGQARRARAELERERASRQAWAEEAMRLQQQIDDDAEPPYWEFPHEWTDGGGGDPWNHVRSHCGACGRAYDDEIHDKPFGPPPVAPGPDAPCACPPNEAVFPGKWTPPQCTVHPVCPAHGSHPHNGMRCLDCSLCVTVSEVLPEGEAP
jgi:hypothetical protein